MPCPGLTLTDAQFTYNIILRIGQYDDSHFADNERKCCLHTLTHPRHAITPTHSRLCPLATDKAKYKRHDAMKYSIYNTLRHLPGALVHVEPRPIERRGATLPDITVFFENKFYALDVTVAEANAPSYDPFVQARHSFVRRMENVKQISYVPYMARIADRFPVRELVPVAVTTGGEIGPAALKFFKVLSGKGVSVSWLQRRLAVLAAMNVFDTHAWYAHRCTLAFNARLGGAAVDFEHGDY